MTCGSKGKSKKEKFSSMFWLVLATCHKVLQEKEKLKKKLVTSRNIRFSENVQIQ